MGFYGIYPPVIKHGWKIPQLTEWRFYESMKGTSLISMVHDFQHAMFDDTGGQLIWIKQ